MMPTRLRTHAGRSAFTIVELLVVIGIIIVLAVGIDMWRDELSRIALFARLRGATARNDVNREGEQK